MKLKPITKILIVMAGEDVKSVELREALKREFPSMFGWSLSEFWRIINSYNGLESSENRFIRFKTTSDKIKSQELAKSYYYLRNVNNDLYDT